MAQVYRVGGAVRDQLLGRPVHDTDWVVVGARAEDMLATGYKPVGKDFPVFLHPDTGEEYALARTERKQGSGYRGFVCHSDPSVTLEQDLLRRDLTINAMAADAQGVIIDPYGGQTDLAARCLRHVSPAFVEDPLRVFRVARFAAELAPLGFHVATETLVLMREMAASGELSSLSAERVWRELQRALQSPAPERFIQVLRDAEALAVWLPEVDALFGVPQRADYHPEIDTGVHTLMALAQAARLGASADVCFAVLVHDLGKAQTPANTLPSHRGHEARGLPLIDALCERLCVPRNAQTLARLVGEYHLDAHRASELKPSTLLKRLTTLDVWRRPQRLADFLLACESDARGRLGHEDNDYWQARYWQGAYQASCLNIAEQLAHKPEAQAVGDYIAALRLQALTQFKEGWHREHA